MDYVIALDRRQRKRQAVHQQLLEAGAKLFRERGIARTTIEDIAEDADVARQTFFNHFPYKEALAVELAADGIQDIAHHAHALLEAGAPALEVLQRSAERVLAAALQDAELAVIVARELLHPEPERAQRAAQLVPLCAIFEAILEQARQEGTVRDDLPLDVAASHLSSVLRCIIAQALVRDPDQLRNDLSVWFEIYFQGITKRS